MISIRVGHPALLHDLGLLHQSWFVAKNAERSATTGTDTIRGICWQGYEHMLLAVTSGMADLYDRR